MTEEAISHAHTDTVHIDTTNEYSDPHPTTTNPSSSDTNLITPELHEIIDIFRPKSMIKSNEEANHENMKLAFESIFAPTYDEIFIWESQYQLQQVARTVSSWFGFSTKTDG